MKRSDAANTFEQGLMMDINPLVTPNNVMTNCLNGTLITYNGNENVLQNDMGNGRVETAYLPEGYVPIGTAELGGIIYIVSYNPLNGKCQIGSFPSPERNFTLDELSSLNTEGVTFEEEDFKNGDDIIRPTVIKQLGNIVLRSGDKFIVCGNSILANINNISHQEDNLFICRYIDFKLATIDNNGRVLSLSDLRNYHSILEDKETNKNRNIYYPIKDGEVESNNTTNIDNYRDMIESDYQIYTSNTEGNLYIVGQLEVIDSIESINWEVKDITNGQDSNLGNTPIIDVVMDEDPNDIKYYTIEYTIKTSSQNRNTVEGFSHKAIPSKEETSIHFKNNNINNVIQFTLIYKAHSNSKIDVELTPYMPFGVLKYLTQTVTINFSLLGSNTVTNNIWQYWKDEDSIHIKFDIYNGYTNKNVTCTMLSFEDLITADLRKDVELPVKESYSGTNIIIVPFDNNIKANSLFKVSLQYKFDSSDQDYILLDTHYLYTNGVFNSKFVADNADPNFDNEFLPLEIVVNTDQISTLVPLENDNVLVDSVFVTKEQDSNRKIKGESKYTANIEVPFHFTVGLKNNYNTFSLRKCEESISFSNEEVAITVESTVNDDFKVDSEYIKEYDSLTSREKINITYNEETKTINYDICLVSPILATTTSREVSVDNYYTSLISREEDLYKYGLFADSSSTGNEFQKSIRLELNGPALGMSAGGSDNTGTGSLQYVCGTAAVANNIVDGSGLLVSGSANSDFSGAGKTGIFRFPNYDVSKTILDNRPEGGIIPVVLANCGASWLRHNNNNYCFFGGTPFDKKTEGDETKVGWFNTQEVKTNFVTSMLFINVLNSEDYVPINYFLVSKSESDTKNIDRYYSLLAQLYAKRPFDGLVKVSTVSNIGYVDKVITASKTLEGKVKYSWNENLYFNGILMASILANQTTPNCMKTLFEDGNIDINNQNLDFKFDIKNTFIETFLQYKSANSIPQYVRSKYSINPPINTNVQNIYIINKDTLASPLQLDQSISIVKSNMDENGNIYHTSTIETADDMKINNLDMLMYNERYDSLSINRSKLNASLILKWGSHDAKFTNNTCICSKGLDAETYVTKLPTHTNG